MLLLRLLYGHVHTSPVHCETRQIRVRSFDGCWPLYNMRTHSTAGHCPWTYATHVSAATGTPLARHIYIHLRTHGGPLHLSLGAKLAQDVPAHFLHVPRPRRLKVGQHARASELLVLGVHARHVPVDHVVPRRPPSPWPPVRAGGAPWCRAHSSAPSGRRSSP